MRELKIAYGDSRKAYFWSNKTITFEELCDRLRTPIRTSETAEEYTKLPKGERDAIKDKGGFVAGHLRGNRRKAENVQCRSMLVYDLDNAEKGFWEQISNRIDCCGCYYTTHSHTPDKPRARVIIPATRDMTPDEFNAVARYYASDKGFITMLDPCSFTAQQLMYWPTCPANGEYLFGTLEGDWLNPDNILEKHSEWRDCSLLPTTPKESKAIGIKIRKQKDPLEKGGIIGAFCRAYYPIEKAIEEFLPDVYEPTADASGRYDYIPGEGSAGVVIYEDRFAYSHHATDPAGGQLCNAFDLVRLHKFGDEENSVAQMREFAIGLDAVKLQRLNEKMEKAEAEFDKDEDWRKHLEYNPKTGKLANSVWNLLLILDNDPDFSNFAFNDLAGRVQVTGSVPWSRPCGNTFWRDADTAHLKSLLDIRYAEFTTRNHDVAFTKIADDRHFHPVRDYLKALPAWDGVKRVDELLIRYLSADDTEYTRAVTRKTLVAAVARVYKPGTKYDNILVLDGVQGIGKSTLFKDLAGEQYYSETLSLTDMNDKAGAEKLQGFWIVEIAELAGMKKMDVEKVKAFLSTADDKYRPSYGKTVESHPRQCVIIGSVNGERGYLRDVTGNRRFWVVKLHQTEQKKKWNFTPAERNQIWAEAKFYYEHGEKLYLEGDVVSAAEEAQKEAMEIDEREGMVESYLETLLPENWESMDLYERRSFLTEKNGIIAADGTVRRNTVSNAEIWCECFGRNFSDLKPTDSYAIAAIMTRIDGWKRTDRFRRTTLYGKQRQYQRLVPPEPEKSR